MTRIRQIGVITGTGVTEYFDLSRPRILKTRYGRATVFEHPRGEYLLIPRHGAEHKSPPQGINYKANIAAFEELGVREIIATSAVGSMIPGFKVGELGLAEQFLDFTKRRPTTFFEDKVVHTDMTNPYSRRLNNELSRAARKLKLALRKHLVYVCAEGPRFETAAEIKMYRMLGGGVVGMTGVPEVVLSNEKNLEYASVLVATNWGAGMQPRVSHEEVLKVMSYSGMTVKLLVEMTVRGLRDNS